MLENNDTPLFLQKYENLRKLSEAIAPARTEAQTLLTLTTIMRFAARADKRISMFD